MELENVRKLLSVIALARARPDDSEELAALRNISLALIFMADAIGELQKEPGDDGPGANPMKPWKDRGSEPRSQPIKMRRRAVRETKELSPQQWREKAKAFRDQAQQAKSEHDREELLFAAEQMESFATELSNNREATLSVRSAS